MRLGKKFTMITCPICGQKIRRYTDGFFSIHYANNIRCRPDFIYDENNTDESVEQEIVVTWATMHIKQYPCLLWLHSNLNGIPLNGSKKSRGRIINSMKKRGMVKGIPDLFLPYPRGPYHGMYMEMKKKNGTPSPDQLAFVKYATEQNYFVSFYYGHKSAIQSLQWYLELI